MSVPRAELLIQQAESGVRLPSKERRHCLQFIQLTKPGQYTNTDLAEIFKVSERQIRWDWTHLREERAKTIKEDDIALVIADIGICFERQIRDLERGKAKAQLGTRTFLDYCKAIAELEVKRVQALQDLGYLPKNLGNMTVDKYEYQAVVTKQTGAVSTVPVHMLPPAKPAELPAPKSDVVEGQFEEVPPNVASGG